MIMMSQEQHKTQLSHHNEAVVHCSDGCGWKGISYDVVGTTRAWPKSGSL